MSLLLEGIETARNYRGGSLKFQGLVVSRWVGTERLLQNAQRGSNRATIEIIAYFTALTPTLSPREREQSRSGFTIPSPSGRATVLRVNFFVARPTFFSSDGLSVPQCTVAHHRIKDRKDLAHASRGGNLVYLSCLYEAVIIGFDQRIAACGCHCDHVQN